MNATYSIPAGNLAPFAARVEQLNKRARRLGVPEIAYTTEHERWEIECELDHGNTAWFGRPPEGCRLTGRRREWLILTVDGQSPKFNGWSFIGVLEPIEADGHTENIVKAVPGHEVPAEYRTRVGQCDHCRTNRRRNETFVVRHDDGTTKLVGRQCLRDFLGHTDPHALAELAGLLAAFGALCESAQGEDFFGLGWGGGEDAYDAGFYLGWTAGVIRNTGWVSRTEARDSGYKTATADRVLGLIGKPPTSREGRREWDEERAKNQPTEAEQAQADAAIEWAANLPEGGSDYLHNIRLVARAGVVTRKTAGLAASIIVAHAREIELEINRQRAATRANEHIGDVGSKIEAEVTVESVRSIEGNYGSTGLHRMIDAAGNSLVWFASESTKWLDQGGQFRIKGTIKKHDEYQGRKQTVLTRVRAV